MHIATIIQYLKKHGQKLDREIATDMGSYLRVLKTGEQVQIPAKHVPHFKSGTDLSYV
ncbi:integration host factor subunit beta [mine drainage metagenome]|uniref:Integration host factor subunit beta n=1 Tax=mine drainage metagenome TaxID=410659 RepID=A0A1J5TKG2_9ZZZZ